MTELAPARRWHPAWLVAVLAGAFVLYGSWRWPVTRAGWDALDVWAFHALHGTVVDAGHGWRLFWAAANTRVFDAVSALGFAVIFAHWVARGGWQPLARRLACGAFIAGATVFVLDFSSNVVFDVERHSPSLVLEPVYRLSQLIDAVKVKDVSRGSFPGDHGTAVLMFTIYITWFCGARHGLVAALLAALVVLPRLVGGAHWLTDLLVGSVSIALVAGALSLTTPLAAVLVGLVERIIAPPLAWLAVRLRPRVAAPPPG